MPCKSGCLLTCETIVMLICPELFLITIFDPCISRGRHSGKMTAHAWLFLRAVCEWTLEGEIEASFSLNFKPSVDGNEFYYLKRHWDFDRDASGVILRKLQTVSGL